MRFKSSAYVVLSRQAELSVILCKESFTSLDLGNCTNLRNVGRKVQRYLQRRYSPLIETFLRTSKLFDQALLFVHPLDTSQKYAGKRLA
jgi:hypothetical protein